MENTTTTPSDIDTLIGASVQIRHDCVDAITGQPHMWAGLHGMITRSAPFGGACISIDGKEKTFELSDFIVTAKPGAAPADLSSSAEGWGTGWTASQQSSTRLVNESPMMAINSTTNPRRRRGLDLDSLRALADSIIAHGLGNPILVRPLPASRVEETSGMDPRPAYEIIAGERRWRAAQLADLPTMPLVVREMDDQAVLEMQLVENIEREDLDPMEEAEGFALLREKLGYTVEQIADKMGKGRGPSYVRKRMKLLDLTPESREAMYDGTLQLSTGLLVARYPADKQAAAVKLIAGMATKGTDGTVVPAPFREVSLALYRKFATILKTAAFDITDHTLVMTAGPCTTCTKRTRAHEDLFAESTDAGEDSCLDSQCWNDKKAAHVQRVHADAQARGLQVIDGTDAEVIAYSPYSSFRVGYVSLDQTAYIETGDDGEEREVTYADALRAQGRKAPKPVVLINPHNSRAEELLPEEVAKTILPKAVQDKKAADADAIKERQEQARAAFQVPAEVSAMRRQDVMRAVLFRLFDSIRQRERSQTDLLLIAEQFLAHNTEMFGHLEQYMGWDSYEGDDPAEYLRDKLAGMDANQLAQIITMAALEASLTFEGCRYDDEDQAVEFVQSQGVDILAVRDKVDDDLRRQNEPDSDEAAPETGHDQDDAGTEGDTADADELEGEQA